MGYGRQSHVVHQQYGYSRDVSNQTPFSNFHFYIYTVETINVPSVTLSFVAFLGSLPSIDVISPINDVGPNFTDFCLETPLILLRGRKHLQQFYGPSSYLFLLAFLSLAL